MHPKYKNATEENAGQLLCWPAPSIIASLHAPLISNKRRGRDKLVNKIWCCFGMSRLGMEQK
jgi:hypothetical protein